MPTLHLDPAGLRAVAAAADALLPGLRVAPLDPADLDVLARLPGGGALVAEHDRLAAGVARVGRELAELAAVLLAAAAGAERADGDATGAITAASP